MFEWIRRIIFHIKYRKTLQEMKNYQEAEREYMMNLQGFIATAQKKFKETPND